MKIEMMNIKIYTEPFLSKRAFMSLLEKMGKDFTPPLSESVELDVYGDKLYTHASFVVVEQDGEIIGFTAFYKNAEAKQLYIPLICVDSCFQGLGIGGKMLSALLEFGKGEYQTIALEVRKSNEQAYRFYKKQGFVEQEDRGEKLLLIKSIRL